MGQNLESSDWLTQTKQDVEIQFFKEPAELPCSPMGEHGDIKKQGAPKTTAKQKQPPSLFSFP